jgi:hypothetical protein
MRALDEPKSSRFSRRSFLTKVGLGARAVAAGGGIAGAFARPVSAAKALPGLGVRAPGRDLLPARAERAARHRPLDP